MRVSLLVAVVLVLVVGGWLLSGQLQDPAPATDLGAEPTQRADDPAGETLPRVQVRTSRAQEIENRVVLSGRTRASRTVQVPAETGGVIDQLLVDDGDEVSAGQVIARIGVDQRRLALDEAASMLNLREIELNAAQRLVMRGFQSEISVAQAQAQYNAAEASVEIARLDLSYTSIRAPFSGIVVAKHTELGAYVGVGDPVLELIDLSPLEVVVQVSERLIGQISNGDAVDITTLDGRTFPAAVSVIGSVADEGTRTFDVELVYENENGELRAGMTAEATLPLGRTLAHQVSPGILTLSDAGAIGVKIIGNDGLVRFRPVDLVREDQNGAWITGLPDTANVIVVGQESVLDGQRVDAVPEIAG